jgi:hypothetical protein
MNVALRMLVAVLTLALCLPVAWAQQKDPRVNPPVAPVGESSSKAPESTTSAPAPAPAPAQQPDTRPLTGVEDFSLGSPGGGRSYLVPSFRITQGFDTNNLDQAGSSNFNHQSNVNASVQLQRIWSRYTLAANYVVGGVMYSGQNGARSPVHNMILSQTIQGRRWSALISDTFGYLPESAFGLGGFGGVGGIGPLPGSSLGNNFGGNLGSLNPILVPNQTIITERATRISNQVMGQFSYAVSPRMSWNVSGGYGILRFLGDGFTNSSNSSFRTGMNYQMNAHDSLGVVYGFGASRFTGTTRAFNTHTVHVSYGRRLTGRLALQFSTGPLISQFRNPLTGSGTRLSWSTSTMLRYAMQDMDVSLSYYRTITGGSGVFLGAQSDVISVNLARELTRTWSMGMDFGYAHNSSLRELNTGGKASATFNSYRAGVSFSRPVGRYASLSLGYNLNYQNQGACATTVCNGRVLRHAFSLGFDWQFHPISLE